MDEKGGECRAWQDGGARDLRVGSIAFEHGFWLLSRRPPLRAREAAVQDSENSVYQMHEKDSEDSANKMHEKTQKPQ